VDLGITVADLTAEGRAELARTDTRPVPAQPARGEVGWTTATRETALRLLDVTGCTTWTAETIEPRYPVTYVDQTHREVYRLDGDRFLIEVTSSRPVCRIEHWSINVNGQAIAHRAMTRALPHGTAAVVNSVWRHLNLVRHEECDALTCTAQPTTAVYGGGYCADHLQLYAK
jgi:hypothetical protein